ncbi:MAG: xanthine dehydrogenase family protein molybdopterin-binding subunit [Clostridiales bacterium]|nr:xanthine dehydrogenase family protein molybdopterin-binding subunit [Clostridiales bacterium]
MVVEPQIGIGLIRKDSWDKVTGKAKYNGDTISRGMLHGRIFTSTCAHGYIERLDISRAQSSKGVQAIVIGKDFPILTGSEIADMPPLAVDRVRYFGEPVAIVVADSEQEAMAAADLIEVRYTELPIVNSIGEALESDAMLVHEEMASYHCPDKSVIPIANTNIADCTRIRKGNMAYAWRQCEKIVEYNFTMPQADHLAMETRNARAEISPDGVVNIYTSTQAPFGVKEDISKAFNIPEGKVIVHTPLVGGAFGGKASTSLEYLAYMASYKVGGRMVRIANPREQDIGSFPCKLGAKGKVRLGATKDGIIKAMECTYYADCGAYMGTGPRMVRAMASDCSGPYNIENIHCDAYSVYTNHNYVTSFRGFGHTVSTFGLENAIKKLAQELEMDELELRKLNAIKPGHLNPTMAKITASNTGNLESCLNRLRELIKWDEGSRIELDDGKILAKGISCFWKTSSSPVNATSGVLLTMNSDGTVNMNFGATEIGPGTKSIMAQILAEKLKMKTQDINVYMSVNTQTSPKHWKTVASMSTIMIGNATIAAAKDLICQIKEVASMVLKCRPIDLDIGDKKVFMIDDPSIFLDFEEIALGYKYEKGPGIYGQLIGRGSYVMRQLIPLDIETGEGKSGVSWTVGAQGVEIEYDPRLYTYRLRKAITVADIGKVINIKTAEGVVMGGMNMGLGLATREKFTYSEKGQLQDTSIRTYKVIHLGEQPEYIVDFIETPQEDTAFGARGIGEHGLIGMTGAFANAISNATGMEFNTIPITPEIIWEKKIGGKYDTI